MAEELKQELENVETNDSENKVEAEYKYTQKDLDSEAGKIRKGTEERLYKQWGVTSKEELQAKIDKLNELEQSKLTEEEKLEQTRLETQKAIEEKQQELQTIQEQYQTEKLKGDLRDLDIRNDRLEQAVALIKASGKEINETTIKEFVDSIPEWKKQEVNPTIRQIGSTGKEESTGEDAIRKEKIRQAIRGR